MENNQISPAIKDHFEVIKVKPGKVKFGKAVYDLRTISLEQAQALVKLKFPYLKEKKAATSGTK